MHVEVLYDYYHYHYNCYCYFAINYRMSSHPGAYFKVLQRFSTFMKMLLFISNK